MAALTGKVAVPSALACESVTGSSRAEEQVQLQQMSPLQRLAEPEDIANAVAFLVSDDAAYVTGHVLHATGGLS